MNAAAEPPTDVRQQTLVSSALGQVERAARHVVRRYGSALRPKELYAVGTFALYRAARGYREEMNDDFQDFAYRRVRDAMRDEVRRECKHHRRMRAAERAGDELLANLRNDEYNVFDHDDEDAERFLQEHADDLLTAAFAGIAEEMQREVAPDTLAAEEEHRRAYEALAEALAAAPGGVGARPPADLPRPGQGRRSRRRARGQLPHGAEPPRGGARGAARATSSRWACIRAPRLSAGEAGEPRARQSRRSAPRRRGRRQRRALLAVDGVAPRDVRSEDDAHGRAHGRFGPGTVIGGKFRLDVVIGRGNMGLVAAAWDLAMERRVAIKLMAPGRIAEEQRERFVREARMAAKLRSEHVVKVLDVSLDPVAPVPRDGVPRGARPRRRARRARAAPRRGRRRVRAAGVRGARRGARRRHRAPRREAREPLPHARARGDAAREGGRLRHREAGPGTAT